MILRELAASLGCAVRGDGDVEVRRVAGIDESGPGDTIELFEDGTAPFGAA